MIQAYMKMFAPANKGLWVAFINLNLLYKEYVKTRNLIKLEKRIRLLHRKLANTRLNHIHQATTAIAKTKPSRVVMEGLNVRGMMKNKHLARAIGGQGFQRI
jgi:putative transposase